jgi:hypothetical protein
VKRVLSDLSPVEVFRTSTVNSLGLSPEVVQTAMNTEFFPGGTPSLSEEQCGSNVTAGGIVLAVDGLLNP